MENRIRIDLSNDEALVLFEFLSRFSESEKLKVEDPSEVRVLWGLQALLEKELSEPFDRDYFQILERARQALRE